MNEYLWRIKILLHNVCNLKFKKNLEQALYVPPLAIIYFLIAVSASDLEVSIGSEAAYGKVGKTW